MRRRRRLPAGVALATFRNGPLAETVVEVAEPVPLLLYTLHVPRGPQLEPEDCEPRTLRYKRMPPSPVSPRPEIRHVYELDRRETTA